MPISHWARSSWMSCVFSTLNDFLLQVKKWRNLRIDAFGSNSVSNWGGGGRENTTEPFQMLQQAYGKDCLSRTKCNEWYQLFKSSRRSIEDDLKSGRSSTTMDEDNVEKVLAVIRKKIVRFLCGLSSYMLEINFTVDKEVKFFMSVRRDICLTVFANLYLIPLRLAKFSREFRKKIHN
jgi:hypothetical protein